MNLYENNWMHKCERLKDFFYDKKYIHFISRKKRRKQGSVEFQVASFTNKIRTYFTFGIAQKRLLSQRGLTKYSGKTNLINTRTNQGKTYERPVTGKKLMIVNMGPHHPSMHGVLRLIVTLDGEGLLIVNPYWILCFTEAITVNGPEQLGNIQVPKRASYIRSYSFSSVLAWPFYGRYWGTDSLFSIFSENENFCHRMRMMHNFFRIGGIAADLPYGWIDKCLDFNELKALGLLVGKNNKLGFIRTNVTRIRNTMGIFVKLIVMSLTMNLSGKFIRLSEMTESIKIIQQALEGLPGVSMKI
ncbi:hypothetical protein HID58_087367 [Brassica napus]|uniref:NAD(P)H dehydrogenase subunit H n=1 Tax=Brassica napus TaxID=3708 RepID=A0ABQ7XVL1_BRANA|nr:hypothetical protein HID58_087367 [Brassica napus]